MRYIVRENRRVNGPRVIGYTVWCIDNGPDRVVQRFSAYRGKAYHAGEALRLAGKLADELNANAQRWMPEATV